MKEYPFYQDEKITMWQRHRFSVMAESEEEAERIICQSRLNTESIHQAADGLQIIFNRTENLLETQNRMAVCQNGGSDTLAVLSIGKKKRVICSNEDEPEPDTVPDTPADQAPLLCSGCGVQIKDGFYNAPDGPFCCTCWEKKPQKIKDQALKDALQRLAEGGKILK